MQIKTQADVDALIGTTWERDGKRRVVTRVMIFYVRPNGTLTGDVYWRRPNGKERKCPMWLFDFQQWLNGATQITGGNDAD